MATRTTLRMSTLFPGRRGLARAMLATALVVTQLHSAPRSDLSTEEEGKEAPLNEVERKRELVGQQIVAAQMKLDSIPRPDLVCCIGWNLVLPVIGTAVWYDLDVRRGNAERGELRDDIDRLKSEQSCLRDSAASLLRELARSDSVDWARALTSPSVAATRDYIREHPTGVFRDSARSRVDSLAWAEVVQTGSLELGLAYLEESARGDRHESVRRMIDEPLWKRTRENVSGEGLREYLRLESDGAHKSEAESLLRVEDSLDYAYDHPTVKGTVQGFWLEQVGYAREGRFRLVEYPGMEFSVDVDIACQAGMVSYAGATNERVSGPNGWTTQRVEHYYASCEGCYVELQYSRRTPSGVYPVLKIHGASRE